MRKELIRILRRSTRALSKGIETYDRERKRSGKGKKETAFEDDLNNSAKALSTSMKDASAIPVDIAELVNKKTYRKRVRRSLRRLSRSIGDLRT